MATKHTTHTQCELQQGSTKQTSWIPTGKAVVGKVIRLKEEDGTWTEGWEVLSAGAVMDSDLCAERQRDWTHQRSVSDI